MSREELLEALEEETWVYIIVEHGNPEDPWYAPQEMYVMDVDVEREIVYLSESRSSYREGFEFYEVFATFEEAKEVIKYI